MQAPVAKRRAKRIERVFFGGPGGWPDRVRMGTVERVTGKVADLTEFAGGPWRESRRWLT